jgi:hypothetical protein
LSESSSGHGPAPTPYSDLRLYSGSQGFTARPRQPLPCPSPHRVTAPRLPRTATSDPTADSRPLRPIGNCAKVLDQDRRAGSRSSTHFDSEEYLASASIPGPSTSTSTVGLLPSTIIGTRAPQLRTRSLALFGSLPQGGAVHPPCAAGRTPDLTSRSSVPPDIRDEQGGKARESADPYCRPFGDGMGFNSPWQFQRPNHHGPGYENASSCIEACWRS